MTLHIHWLCSTQTITTCLGRWCKPTFCLVLALFNKSSTYAFICVHVRLSHLAQLSNKIQPWLLHKANKLTTDKRNIGPQLQLIKVLPNRSYCYQYSPEPQCRKDDFFICNCYPNPFPHPEIRTSVPGDLHQRTDHLTGDSVRASPNAGRQHQHRTGDSKQPVQTGPVGNTMHAPYK